MEYRPRVPPHRGPVTTNHSFSDSKDQQISLNTRSMDAGFSRGKRTPTATTSRREVRFIKIYAEQFIMFWVKNYIIMI